MVTVGALSLQNIHDLWMSLELEGATAAITSVDAQPSHCQGVVVFVTGELQGRVGIFQLHAFPVFVIKASSPSQQWSGVRTPRLRAGLLHSSC
jgi:hypothetical protein